LVTSGGDIDNRIKVLFDGLKMPETVSELGGVALESEEDPFFCLLEDDNLINQCLRYDGPIAASSKIPAQVREFMMFF